MRFKRLNGSSAFKSYRKREIDWDGKSLSKFQRAVKLFLKPYWKDDLVFEELPVLGTRMTIDIYNANKKIAVEADGNQHRQFIGGFYHASPLDYLNQIKRDVKKREWCEVNGILLVNIFEDDLKDLSPQWFLEKYKINL